MTISNANNNLASLVSRIEQLEAQQEIWKKNTIWLKRCFDELKQEFNKLAELSQVDTQEKILQLSAQVEELQQHFERVARCHRGKYEAIEDVDIDDGEQDNHLADVTKHQKFTKMKKRVLWKIVSGEEFWERYENGDRNFKGINLTGADLTENSPSDVNLSKANLSQVRLSGTNWSNEKLSGANLTQADLNNTSFCNANLKEAILDDAFLCQAKLESADLYKASLKGANLTEANLS